VQLTSNEAVTCVIIASIPPTIIWGVVSARMQAKPWRMMALAVLVTAGATVFQLMVNAQPVLPPPFHDIVEKMRVFQNAWISVALGMGGALMGAAVAAQSAQLHADELRRLEKATTDIVESIRATRKEVAAWRASARPESEVEDYLARAEVRLALEFHDFQSIQRDRERLKLPRVSIPR
jgi:uncharacterized membrane protein YjfL (UPF0719 family)